jgi:hypothetical protein
LVQKQMAPSPVPEGVKKLNDLGSPRPNEGEGLGVRGAMHAASSSKRG